MCRSFRMTKYSQYFIIWKTDSNKQYLIWLWHRKSHSHWIRKQLLLQVNASCEESTWATDVCAHSCHRRIVPWPPHTRVHRLYRDWGQTLLSSFPEVYKYVAHCVGPECAAWQVPVHTVQGNRHCHQVTAQPLCHVILGALGNLPRDPSHLDPHTPV